MSTDYGLAMVAVLAVLVVGHSVWSIYRYRKPAAWPQRRMSLTAAYAIIWLPLAMSTFAISLFFVVPGHPEIPVGIILLSHFLHSWFLRPRLAIDARLSQAPEGMKGEEE